MPNYDTFLSPSTFRQNSLVHHGYLPELDLDVFEHLRLVDYGNADVVHDMKQTLANVEKRVKEIIDAGCIPVTMGGNAGPVRIQSLKPSRNVPMDRRLSSISMLITTTNVVNGKRMTHASHGGGRRGPGEFLVSGGGPDQILPRRPAWTD